MHFQQANGIQSKKIAVYVAIHGMKFNNDEMTEKWYNGHHYIRLLTVHTYYLNAIHENAFISAKLQMLMQLRIYIDHGFVIVHNGAYNGLHYINNIFFYAQHVSSFGNQLFSPTSAFITGLEMYRWPNNVNLDEIFAGQAFRRLQHLTIEKVAPPQMKFRVLAASNFTAFYRLRVLQLVNCGIETIEEHTFHSIGETLALLRLDRNPIKSLNLDTFRAILETKIWIASIGIAYTTTLGCTDDAIELNLVQYPALNEDGFIHCVPNDKYDDMHKFQQIVNPEKYCTKRMYFDGPLRFIKVHLKRDGERISIDTNFTSRVRMLFINFNALGASCSEIAKKSHFQCININKSIDHLHLHTFGGNSGTEFISVTAIPMLNQLGVCPLHLITVRKPQEHEFDILGCQLLVVLGNIIAGCAVAIKIILIRRRTKFSPNEDRS